MGYVGKVTDGGSTHLVGSTLYGTCDTAAATVAKLVTCSDFTTLITGVTVHIKFTYNNTAAKPTLNVNGTGAKAIKRYGTTAPAKNTSGSWNVGAVVSFTYDGTYWMMNDWLNNNTTYSVATQSANGLMSSTDKTKLDGLSGLLVIDVTSFSSLPVTASDSNITANHVVIEYSLSDPSAMAGTWACTTSDGSLTVRGTMTSGSSTTMRLILGLASNL